MEVVVVHSCDDWIKKVYNIAKERIDKELEKQNGIRNESENNEGAVGASAVGLSTI